MNGFQNMLSSLRGMGAPRNAPRVAQAPAKRVPKRSWQDKAYIIGAGLQDMGGGEGNLDAAAAMFGKRDTEAQALERRQMLDQQARAVITDPREWAVYQADPEAWAKETATRYAAANVGGGDSRKFGENGPVYTAPKYSFEGDQAVSVGPEGMSILGTRNPTFDEQTGRMNADTGRMNAERPMAVGDGGEVIDPRTGRVIYRNAKTFAPPRVGGGRGGAGGSGAKLPSGFILDGN